MESSVPARRFKIPNARSLDNIALHYLSRYAASEFSLRRVLENRLRRAAMRNHEFAADDALQRSLRQVIDQIIEKHKKSGVLNDAAYAEMKTASLRRAGRSARAIKAKLGQRGIAKTVIEDSLDHNPDGLDSEDADKKAAFTFARRKRLGPFRKKVAPPEQARKDLAALARAGFSISIAREILGRTVADDGDDFDSSPDSL